jgi:hypothetical protein
VCTYPLESVGLVHTIPGLMSQSRWMGAVG